MAGLCQGPSSLRISASERSLLLPGHLLAAGTTLIYGEAVAGSGVMASRTMGILLAPSTDWGTSPALRVCGAADELHQLHQLLGRESTICEHCQANEHS